VVVALAVAIVTLVALVPRRATADDSLVYIIPAAVGGVVIVVLLVAILVVNRDDESEFELAAEHQLPPDPPASGLRFAPACGLTSERFALICW
jgi:hypothetical protein